MIELKNLYSCFRGEHDPTHRDRVREAGNEGWAYAGYDALLKSDHPYVWFQGQIMKRASFIRAIRAAAIEGFDVYKSLHWDKCFLMSREEAVANLKARLEYRAKIHALKKRRRGFTFQYFSFIGSIGGPENTNGLLEKKLVSISDEWDWLRPRAGKPYLYETNCKGIYYLEIWYPSGNRESGFIYKPAEAEQTYCFASGSGIKYY